MELPAHLIATAGSSSRSGNARASVASIDPVADRLHRHLGPGRFPPARHPDALSPHGPEPRYAAQFNQGTGMDRIHLGNVGTRISQLTAASHDAGGESAMNGKDLAVIEEAADG
jgi:hypothetical protein